MINMLESFEEKITVRLVVEKLRMAHYPKDPYTGQAVEFTTAWIVLHPIDDPDGWSIYAGDAPWHIVTPSWFGNACLILDDLNDLSALEHIAREMIQDLADNFTDEGMPELLRD